MAPAINRKQFSANLFRCNANSGPDILNISTVFSSQDQPWHSPLHKVNGCNKFKKRSRAILPNYRTAWFRTQKRKFLKHAGGKQMEEEQQFFIERIGTQQLPQRILYYNNFNNHKILISYRLCVLYVFRQVYTISTSQ